MADEVFEWLERAPHTAVTSTMTMTELLVAPYREGNMALVGRYFALLSQYPHLEWIAPDLAIADNAARLRARHKLRTPDAIQVATAIQGGAGAMITNDPGMCRVEAMEFCLFDDYRQTGVRPQK